MIHNMADITGKKAVLIVAPANFRDEELLHTKEILDDAGVETYIASKGVRIAKGSQGRNSDVDLELTKLDVNDYDAIIFIGGSGTSVYLNDSVAQRIAKDSLEQGKILAAICMAPSILANAGLLKDINVTSFSGEEKNLRAKGANFTGESVTVDGMIITGNGPEAAYDFGKAIVEKLSGE
jgi:protease I